MGLDAKGLQLLGSWYCAGWIVATVKVGGDGQTSLSAGGANEAEDLLVAIEWFTGPVLGDLREETMFDGVPFGSTCWVVGDGERQAV